MKEILSLVKHVEYNVHVILFLQYVCRLQSVYMYVMGSIFHITILDIKSVDFLQFQWDFIPQSKMEEAFIYIFDKTIDFSERCRHVKITFTFT